MTISEAIATYIEEKEKEATAKKRKEAMRAIIIEYMGNNDIITTDEYTAILKKTTSNRLNTKALYKDFPDVKDVYSKPTTSTELIATKNAKPEGKTA